MPPTPSLLLWKGKSWLEMRGSGPHISTFLRALSLSSVADCHDSVARLAGSMAAVAGRLVLLLFRSSFSLIRPTPL